MITRAIENILEIRAWAIAKDDRDGQCSWPLLVRERENDVQASRIK